MGTWSLNNWSNYKRRASEYPWSPSYQLLRILNITHPHPYPPTPQPTPPLPPGPNPSRALPSFSRIPPRPSLLLLLALYSPPSHTHPLPPHTSRTPYSSPNLVRYLSFRHRAFRLVGRVWSTCRVVWCSYIEVSLSCSLKAPIGITRKFRTPLLTFCLHWFSNLIFNKERSLKSSEPRTKTNNTMKVLEN